MKELLEIYKDGKRIYWSEIQKSKSIKDPITLRMDISEEMIGDLSSWADKHKTTLHEVVCSLFYNKWKRIKKELSD